jgi:hypothetical protein
MSSSRPLTLTLSTDPSSRHIFEASGLQGRLFDHLVSRKAKQSALPGEEVPQNQERIGLFDGDGSNCKSNVSVRLTPSGGEAWFLAKG